MTVSADSIAFLPSLSLSLLFSFLFSLFVVVVVIDGFSLDLYVSICGGIY